MNKDDYQKIDSSLYAVYYGIQRVEEQELRKSTFNDLTIKEMHAIDAITLHSQLTSSEVAKKLHLTPGTMTNTADRLVKKGYVERVKDDSDRRVIRLALTRKGRVLCRAYRAYHNMMAKSFLNGMSDDELVIIKKALSNLEEFLNKH